MRTTTALLRLALAGSANAPFAARAPAELSGTFAAGGRYELTCDGTPSIEAVAETH